MPVWGTTRSRERAGNPSHFQVLEMRLEDVASIEAAWNEARAQAGQIDIVIQNAGAGIFGSLEDVSLHDARWQWQVLVEGPLRLLQLAAAHLRPRREGIIMGVSSLRGRICRCRFRFTTARARPPSARCWQGLSMELKPFGVQVVDLRPGDSARRSMITFPKPCPPIRPIYPGRGKRGKNAQP